MQTFFIDTFTGKDCKGNPTVVCLLNEPFANSQCQQLAKQYDIPVTAFVDVTTQKNDLLSIRYFTVSKQIPACGHATLAAAKLLFGLLRKEEISFLTVQQLTINAKQEGGLILLRYPAYSIKPVAVSKQLLESLQLKEIATAGFSSELETLFIELDSAAELRKLKPAYRSLMNSSDTIKEVVVTSISDDDRFDYLLRSFCPWIGIDEDPVTGSVHSVLAHYWARLFNKTKLNAYQASTEGGEIFVEAADDFVWIGGRVTSAHAEQVQ